MKRRNLSFDSYEKAIRLPRKKLKSDFKLRFSKDNEEVIGQVAIAPDGTVTHGKMIYARAPYLSELYSIDKGRVVTPVAGKEDEAFDRAVRPRKLAEYIGQPRVKAQMEIFIAAARQRREALDHTLLFGPPGLGKTTLAHIIANELGVSTGTLYHYFPNKEVLFDSVVTAVVEYTHDAHVAVEIDLELADELLGDGAGVEGLGDVLDVEHYFFTAFRNALKRACMSGSERAMATRPVEGRRRACMGDPRKTGCLPFSIGSGPCLVHVHRAAV